MATEPNLSALDADLAILAQQEQMLRFAHFGADAAWQLGSQLRELAQQQSSGCTMEIEVAGQLRFASTTQGARPGQANWIRRKRNTVRHFGQSTYAVGRKLERDGTTLSSAHGIAELDHAAHGGGFPIYLRDTGVVGSVVLSGLPQREDHNVVVAALAAFLRVDVPRLP